jgi:hypothetical protein
MRTKKSVVLPRTLAKRMRWFTGAGAACIALIGVVGWFALPQGSTPTNYLLEAGYLEIRAGLGNLDRTLSGVSA